VAALLLDGLRVGYRRGRRERVIVPAVTAELPAGTFAALVGANGAGKSSLLRTTAGLLPPLAGSVRIAGAAGTLTDLHRLSARERAQRLGVVLTERLDLSVLTAYDVIALGRLPYTDWLGRLSAVDHTAIADAIDAVGAGALAGERFHELSDGQRQRVLIARALAQQPAVIVLDEPTAFLDVTGRAAITRLLRAIAHQTGRAILASTHELALALELADQIWVLHDGQLVAGTLENIHGALTTAFPDF